MNPAISTAAPTTTRLQALLRDILAERDQWLSTVEFDAASRWYRAVDISHHESGLDVEAWLLSWLPGQRTGLHDHGGAAGGFVVASGSLREHSVTIARTGRPRLLTASRDGGRVRLFGAHHIHEMVNVSAAPAVSVHVYSPALSTMTRYRWTRRGPVVTAVERAGADW